MLELQTIQLMDLYLVLTHIGDLLITIYYFNLDLIL